MFVVWCFWVFLSHCWLCISLSVCRWVIAAGHLGVCYVVFLSFSFSLLPYCNGTSLKIDFKDRTRKAQWKASSINDFEKLILCE